jgi:hypothetical protein
MGNCQLEPVPIVVCCCGHAPEYHLGGPDLDAEGLVAFRLAHPDGDGGMCRASVPSQLPYFGATQRCDCFNLCDCNYVARDIRSDGTDMCAALALEITKRDWDFPVKVPR